MMSQCSGNCLWMSGLGCTLASSPEEATLPDMHESHQTPMHKTMQNVLVYVAGLICEMAPV